MFRLAVAFIGLLATNLVTGAGDTSFEAVKSVGGPTTNYIGSFFSVNGGTPQASSASASAQSNAQASSSVPVDSVQVLVMPGEPPCRCLPKSMGCKGREDPTKLFEKTSTLVCGGEFVRCCFEDPWPGIVDTFANVLPCLPIESCGRYYGQAATDVAEFGVIGPCPGFGAVRCIGAEVVQVLEVVQAAPVVTNTIPGTSYGVAVTHVSAPAVPAPVARPFIPAAPAVVAAPVVPAAPAVVAAPVAPAAPAVFAAAVVAAPVAPVPPLVLAHPVPAVVDPVVPVAPVPVPVPVLTHPGPPYLWNSLRFQGLSWWPQFGFRKQFGFGFLG